jgi:hypothetical protein
MAIGLVRHQAKPSKDFLPGFQGIGVILSFTVVVFLFGTGLVLFFLPYLTLATETAYGVLRTAAKPLGPILVGILRFIFMHGAIPPENPSSSPKEPIGDLTSPVRSSGWIEVLEKILAWVFGGLLGLIVLIVAAVALFFLFRWLLSRTSIPQKRQGLWNAILSWIDELRILLDCCWRWIIRKTEGYRRAGQLYTALLNWGRHGGLSHLLSETPREYGLRLKNRFPSLKEEIGLIVEAFHQEVYGEIILSEQRWVEAMSAWRRLRSPLRWPSRLKSWFSGSTPSPL